jgi:hypothetical protein
MLFVANVSIATLSIIACTTFCYEDGRGKCLYFHDYERCDNVLLPCLATNNYGCKKPQHLQRQTSNGCNTLLQRDFLQSLATNVICLQLLPFATKLGLLQHFFIVAQGLEVSSHTPPQRNQYPCRPNTPSTEQTINKNVSP